MILHHNGHVYRLVKHQQIGGSCRKCQLRIDKYRFYRGLDDCPRIMGTLACVPEHIEHANDVYRFIHNTPEALAAYVAETLGAETTP